MGQDDVTLEGALKCSGTTRVIHGIDLEIADGEFCVFVGQSGCGPSTQLRMIAGQKDTSAGTIRIGTRDAMRLDPAKRGVAMVAQSHGLWSHMTVAENLVFSLRMNRVPRATIRATVAKASDTLASLFTASPRHRSAVSVSAVRPGAAPRCFCSMKPCPTSTRSCASICASGSPACISRSTPR